MAALLAAAPQCVPFAQRLEVFRATLAEDKARGGFAAPVAQGGAPPIKAWHVFDDILGFSAVTCMQQLLNRVHVCGFCVAWEIHTTSIRQARYT